MLVSQPASGAYQDVADLVAQSQRSSSVDGGARGPIQFAYQVYRTSQDLSSMTVQIQRPSGVNVGVNNPGTTVYFKGNSNSVEAWRAVVVNPPDKLSFQHFEPLTEAGITLDEAKVLSIESNSIYTAANPYFAEVSIDSRANQALPVGISGDMTGLFIEWDGFIWANFPEQWVEKGNFSESFFSDRGVFQRMTVIETDPNDPARYPPTPAEGTTIGSRNTQSDGAGVELLSFNDKNGHFGQLLEVIHGGAPELINQIQGVKADAALIGIPYEPAHVAGSIYAIGDIVVDQGVRFKCNSDGVQTGIFSAETAKWDPIDRGGFDVDTILTAAGAVLVANGNVLVVTP